MKKYSILALFLFLAFGLQAGGDKYVQAMKGAIQLMADADMDPAKLTEAANRFERIGQAEKKEWLPQYYAAFCYIQKAFVEKDPSQKDQILDKAEAFLNRAEELAPKEAEIVVMKGMLYTGRLMVDPQARGMEFGMKAGQMYGKAKNMDGDNPRALYYYGQNLAFTPEQFGGGRDKGIPIMEEAMTKFEGFEPKSEIHPDWGQEEARKTLEMLKSGEEMPWEEEEMEVEDDFDDSEDQEMRDRMRNYDEDEDEDEEDDD